MLDEFDGQLSYTDIMHMTYKEIGYLRKARAKLKEKKGATLKDVRV